MAEASKLIRLKVYPHHTHTHTHTHTHSRLGKNGSSASLLCYLSPAQTLCSSSDSVLICLKSEVGSRPADEPNPEVLGLGLSWHPFHFIHWAGTTGDDSVRPSLLPSGEVLQAIGPRIRPLVPTGRCFQRELPRQRLAWGPAPL